MTEGRVRNLYKAQDKEDALLYVGLSMKKRVLPGRDGEKRRRKKVLILFATITSPIMKYPLVGVVILGNEWKEAFGHPKGFVLPYSMSKNFTLGSGELVVGRWC